MSQTFTEAGVPVLVPDDAPIIDTPFDNAKIDALVNDPGEAPQIPLPPSCVVELPTGIMDLGGRIHTTATVRELTGEDEEDMYRTDKTGNPLVRNDVAMTDKVLSRCVVELGDTGKPASITEIEAAFMGDRDALMLGVRRATYGDTLETPIICWSCKTELVAEIDLDEDIEVHTLPGRPRTFDVALRNGVTATVRFIIGLDQRALADTDKVQSLADANTVILNSCVVALNGVAPKPAALKKMGLGDRNKILKKLEETQPGPKLRGVKVPCSTCDAENIVNIGMASLLQGS